MTGLDPRDLALIHEEAAEFGLPVTDPDVVRDTSPTGDGGTVAALRWGTGAGGSAARAVFLHGAGLNAHTWNTTVLALAAGDPDASWPAVALDLPGHGDSSWHDDVDYGPERVAAAVAPAFDAWAPAADVVVGQSLGGLTAIALAGRRPDLVRRLVVVDITPGFVASDDTQVRAFLAGPTSFATRDEIVERALSFGYGPTRQAVARGVERNTRARDDGRFVWKSHVSNLAAQLAEAGHELPAYTPDFSGLWSTLEGLTVPVLLVRGTRGYLTDELVDEFVGRAPAATCVTIDAGHNVQEDRPVELARAIADFVPR